MTTSFAAQLSHIAATSTHELDLRARRNLHAESLIFPRDVAVKQDFDTIYTISLDGFRDLCQLDVRFAEFDRNLFSQQAKEQDRDQMTHGENEALDIVLDRFLGLLGGKILLSPAVKTLEWLVRRFRVHIHNTASLILMLLPYHELPIWRNVISIIPLNKLVAEWKWAAPYKSDSLNIPRHAIVHALTNNDGFWTKWNIYMITTAKERFEYATLLQFWNSTVVEAVVGRLSAARSGRRELQRERMQDALLKILPILSDGFEVKNSPDLTVALFTIAMVLAARADLDDRVLDSLLHTVCAAMKTNVDQVRSVIVTAASLISQKHNRIMPRQTVDIFRNLPHLEEQLQSVLELYSIDALIEGLVAGTLSSLSSKKRNLTLKIDFLERLIRFASSLKDRTALKACVVHILKRISQQSAGDDETLALRSSLLEVVQRRHEEAEMTPLLLEIAHDLGQTTDELEGLFGGTITLPGAESVQIDAMDVDEIPIPDTSLHELLASAPSRTADVSSFLSSFDTALFDHLLRCFEKCSRKESNLLKFLALPIWSSATSGQVLLLSFLLRIGVGNYSILLRTTALKLVTRSLQDKIGVDAQALVPYALAALCENSSSVIRSVAAELLVAIQKSADATEISEQLERSELYGKSHADQTNWIPNSQLLQILQQIIIPRIEDCILDASEMKRVIESAMNGPPQTEIEGLKIANLAPKKGVSRSLLDLIASHAVATPVWRVKLQIITLLDNVQKVGTTSKTTALAPILNEWILFTDSQAQMAAQAEGLDPHDLDAAIASIISPSTKDKPNDILNLLEQDMSALRPNFAKAVFDRLGHIWSDLKHPVQISVALKLFDISFIEVPSISKWAQNFLQLLELSTDAVGAILEQSLSGITQMQSEEQPRKRRRTSHGRENLPADLARAVEAAVSRLTLSLELVEGSKVEDRPEILPVLFDTLALLRRLKQQQRVESPYLLHLCLSNMYTIVKKQAELPKPLIDFASIRMDLVTDCIQTSESPQAHNSALLLSASLASLTPDQMLHQVMPIFTFIGQNMFAKEDDHSVFVTSQAISHIIPALVKSLRKQNKDMIKSTSGILSSFAAAFDHIPQHRKVPIYQQLLSNMGSQDFAFILIAMLAVRKGLNRSFISFLNDLMAEFPVLVQIVTYRKLLNLVMDLTSIHPTIASDVFDVSGSDTAYDSTEAHDTILNACLHLSLSKNLATTMKKLHKIDVAPREALQNELTIAIRQILSIIKNDRTAGRDVDLPKQCLDALLKLPPLSELLYLTPAALQEMDAEEDLKPQIIRVLASQLDGNPARDTRTRTAAGELLSKLSSMLSESSDPALLQALIVAIDRLTETDGRKHVDIVLQTATAISSDVCLKSGSSRTKTMSLLCLASMLEVLKEASAPIISDVVDKTSDMFRDVFEHHDEEVYIALNSLVAVIISHLSFLISDEALQNLIFVCSEAAHTYNSVESVESRMETLKIIARKVDFPALLGALQHIASTGNSEVAPMAAKLESLDVLSTAIETASKVQVIKHAEAVSEIILAHLDHRRKSVLDASDDANISSMESKVNEVSIGYIYKLNDTTFRPVFETWVDWATKAHNIVDVSDIENARKLRQTALFSLLAHFFNTLKSIVTSYASYIIVPAAAVLQSVDSIPVPDAKKPSFDQTQLDLYNVVLDLLRATFTHDADGFFATPSHFEPLGPTLIKQLYLATSKTHRNMVYKSVIPTIVALATAVTDTPTHHQSLCHELTLLRRSSFAAIRLASIRTLAALTDDEDVGNDFIANTIGVGSAAVADGDGMGIARGGGSSAGELMIYVNEMLEDDDEDVEMEVRKWVQSVREKVGEDVFEV